ncbi:hypothetical protein [Aquibacillus rhizosphaerae]|uniref:Uncharacterized protein n=1 Tax=Aquibacillus rhizosphaerae TaxID=3051431 RepID=A0ABT7L9N6_9BACI|nr:hypothetical protein [Aquibacillus sp. LR5S19]MDL4842567.1 hypothetical protein [Aquibacillus sp. LR5S19]
MNRFKTVKKVICLLAIIPLLLFPYEKNEPGDVSAQNYNVDDTLNRSSSLSSIDSNWLEVTTNEREQHTEGVELSHQEIISLTDKFMELLVQEVDDQYKVVHFKTKASLISAFSSVSSTEVAKEYIDFFYEERNDNLYIIPTETPPWFQKDADYEMIKVDNQNMKIVQENISDLHGSYKIELIMTYDNKWRITEINHY